MTLLTPMTSAPAYLKAGFLGFAGAGKTYTAVELALGVRQHFKLDGPIVFYDTENGSDYVRARIERETGQPLLGRKGRNLDEVVAMINEAAALENAVMIVDSVTHLWRQVCDGYLDQRNQFFKSKGWKRRQTSLEFQDWGPVKRKWATFADLVINGPIHLIICGRAGHEYDYDQDESGKKTLVKTGIKMKTENEFGFEPSLIVEMQRTMHPETHKVERAALVIKDRFGVIDGQSCKDPTAAFFAPHIEALQPGQHSAVSTDAPEFDLDDGGDDEWRREKTRREIACEEIKGLLTERFPGQTKEEKEAKQRLLHKYLGTRSWKKVEQMHSRDLLPALDQMVADLEPDPPEEGK